MKLLPCLLLVATAPLLSAENLLLNPGFEEVDDTGFAMEWKAPEQVATNGATAVLSESEANSGSRALVLQLPVAVELPAGAEQAPNTENYIRNNNLGAHVLVLQRVPVEGGRKYNFRFSYNATGMQRRDPQDPKTTFAYATVQIFWLTQDGKAAGENNVTLLRMIDQDTGGWQESLNAQGASPTENAAQAPIEAPQEASQAEVRMSLSVVGPVLTPKVTFDDFSFEMVEE